MKKIIMAACPLFRFFFKLREVSAGTQSPRQPCNNHLPKKKVVSVELQALKMKNYSTCLCISSHRIIFYLFEVHVELETLKTTVKNMKTHKNYSSYNTAVYSALHVDDVSMQWKKAIFVSLPTENPLTHKNQSWHNWWWVREFSQLVENYGDCFSWFCLSLNQAQCCEVIEALDTLSLSFILLWNVLSGKAHKILTFYAQTMRLRPRKCLLGVQGQH